MKNLTIFIDGLKPESVEHMPFLDKMITKKRIKTDLGYSVTCHASMYTGVHPNKHLRWFLWKYSPSTSPSKWIHQLKIDLLPQNFYTKYGWYKLVRFFDRNTSYYKLPLLWHLPIKCWHYLDMTEKKFWGEPGFIDEYPTIFDMLSQHKIQYETVGFVKEGLETSSKIIEKHRFDKIKPWTFFFIGDVDPLSHRYGQDSSIMIEKLKEIDAILEKKYLEFEGEVGLDFCFMLFSDHGHIKINKKIRLETHFEESGESLDDYIHFIDANYARFWFRDADESDKVSKILSELNDIGFVLTDKHLKKYNINMPDNRYGDLIYYLDAPYSFDHSVTVAGKKRGSGTVSGHGYLPDHPDSDGIFISNMDIPEKTYVSLVDILPSILKQLNIPIPSYIDGESLWK